jgi:NTE family protein
MALLTLAGCATRPINPPIAHADPNTGYRYGTREFKDKDTLVVLAFSGGGTRAAAFSYGVLEQLKDTEVIKQDGKKIRLLDTVAVITGVSGGSFTALAYGLYGDRLFAEYEQRFLKRNVQGELIARFLNPLRWGNLALTEWGRSEMAADLYDEILFNGATFADLDRRKDLLVLAAATDVSTGARMDFGQEQFDAICSDLDAVRLSRAAAASSAVPVALSPVTLNNYGGTCDYAPAIAMQIASQGLDDRAAARAKRQANEWLAFADGASRPYIHLVDGGLADNVGMRGVLTVLDIMEARHAAGLPTPFDHLQRIVVIVVNSATEPRTDWDRKESPPGPVDLLLQSSGVPMEHYSFESMELLRDRAEGWRLRRDLLESVAFKANTDPAIARKLRAPDIDLYPIDVSFGALKDRAEFEYLNGLPTSFVLPSEAVDRLRAAARKLVTDSPEFQRLLKELGAKIEAAPAAD